MRSARLRQDDAPLQEHGTQLIDQGRAGEDEALTRPVEALQVERRLALERDEAERPFYSVMGPFGPEQLQRFSDKVGAVLYAGAEPVGQFPAAAARILEGQPGLL
ncbi:hypothetical protein [Methylobacterium nodulans]|uniref:Uncharacterized protein n=1 Tax=Methylobacterium nodulans (strain LMG 21967 / CNCM I-2342 / ORS 2060) TaxID=460265 RepID=B8IKX5_METNO|nr:hypothetical protein Mnod_3239 [Methylobacterium nodulans ORS 2060]